MTNSGENISKANVYAFLGPPIGLSFSKANVYAFLKTITTQGSYVGAGSIYLGGQATTSGRVGLHSYVGSGSIIIGGAATTRGRHYSQYSGNGVLKLTGRSDTYNVIGIPAPFGGSSRVMDLTMEIDAVDFGLQVNHLGGMGVTQFFRSMFIIDTADRNGICTYQPHIIAKNTSGSDQTVSLKRVLGYTFDPDTFSDASIATFTVPAMTTEWTMIFTDATFVPATGKWAYYYDVPDVAGVIVATGRVRVKQIGATDTLLWRPAATSGEGTPGGFNEHLGFSWGSPDSWQRPTTGNWYWDSTLYTANQVTIVLEACTGSSYGGVDTDICLWDETVDQQVPGSSFSIRSGGAFRWPQSLVDRHEFIAGVLVDGHLYSVRFRRHNSWGGGVTTDFLSSSLFGRASFGIRLRGIRACEIVYRVSKADGAPVGVAKGSSRVRLDGVGGNSVLKYIKNETCSNADFYFSAVPEVDFWITDDGHRMLGDGDSAVIVPSSNAHQDPVSAQLPIFSADWKDNFTPSNIYCMRQLPTVAGGDANSAWTLICVGLESSYVTPPCSVCMTRVSDEVVCLQKTPLGACLVAEEQGLTSMNRTPVEGICFSRVSEPPVCLTRVC